MKKILSLVLALSLFANMSIGISAFHEAENYVPITQITREELVNCALNLAREIVPGVKLTIGENIIPIYEQTGLLVGYSLEYFQGETPYGFLNLDFRKENPIVDFSISEGCTGIYDNIVSVVEQDEEISASLEKLDTSTSKQQTFAPKMYAMGLGTYGISMPNSTMIYTPINAYKIVKTTVSDNDSRSSTVAAYDNHADIYSSNYSGTVVTAPTYIEQYSSIDSIISEAYIENATGRYACAVLALTEIANQEGILYNNSIADTFLELWDYTDTYDSTTEINNGIWYGSTNTNNVRSGMISYVNARGYNCSVTRNNNAAFSFFEDMVDANRSGLLSYWIDVIVYDEDGQHEETQGHTINVFGYCVTRISGSLTNYIIVADGWTFSPRFLCYSDTEFCANPVGMSFLIT